MAIQVSLTGHQFVREPVKLLEHIHKSDQVRQVLQPSEKRRIVNHPCDVYDEAQEKVATAFRHEPRHVLVTRQEIPCVAHVMSRAAQKKTWNVASELRDSFGFCQQQHVVRHDNALNARRVFRDLVDIHTSRHDRLDLVHHGGVRSNRLVPHEHLVLRVRIHGHEDARESLQENGVVIRHEAGRRVHMGLVVHENQARELEPATLERRRVSAIRKTPKEEQRRRVLDSGDRRGFAPHG